MEVLVMFVPPHVEACTSAVAQQLHLTSFVCKHVMSFITCTITCTHIHTHIHTHVHTHAHICIHTHYMHKYTCTYTQYHREEAELEYLRVAQDLEMYGVNYFDIKVG